MRCGGRAQPGGPFMSSSHYERIGGSPAVKSVVDELYGDAHR